ncbi:hypothetical protein [Chachezhania sediminis]|uniref:hypothetical protein n=1 Tax=Chachezhania sediminis TaxID=2599291 RepID=UPI00131B241F|nr:hypothetical protein [Chachezhania sediminis]
MIAAGDLTGHWIRDWIRAPGLDDAETRVHWLQARDGYCDLRVPRVRPDLSSLSCLAEAETPVLLALLQAEGFAGTIEVLDEVCTWDRAINWHGAPDGVDAGRLHWTNDGRLIEDGTAADYRELWHREIAGALNRKVFAGADGKALHVIWSERLFLYGIGTPGAAGSAPLRQALNLGQRPAAALLAQFDAEYGLGRWRGEDGVIALCTNPLREGQSAFERTDLHAMTFTTTRTDFLGRPSRDTWQA